MCPNNPEVIWQRTQSWGWTINYRKFHHMGYRQKTELSLKYGTSFGKLVGIWFQVSYPPFSRKKESQETIHSPYLCLVSKQETTSQKFHAPQNIPSRTLSDFELISPLENSQISMLPHYI